MTPCLDRWFSLSIRRERKSFILASLALMSILVFVFTVFYFIDISEKAKGLFLILYSLLGLVCSYTLTAQRLRDMNLTGWLAFICVPLSFSGDSIRTTLVGLFLLVLWVVPGTPGVNKYGPSPVVTDTVDSV